MMPLVGPQVVVLNAPLCRGEAQGRPVPRLERRTGFFPGSCASESQLLASAFSRHLLAVQALVGAQ